MPHEIPLLPEHSLLTRPVRKLELQGHGRSGVGSVGFHGWSLNHLGLWGYAWKNTWFKMTSIGKKVIGSWNGKAGLVSHMLGFSFQKVSSVLSFFPSLDPFCCVAISPGLHRGNWQSQPPFLSHSHPASQEPRRTHHTGSGQARWLLPNQSHGWLPQRKWDLMTK